MSPKDLEAIENIKWDPPFPYDPASGWKKSSINVKNYGRMIHSSKVRFRFLHCQVRHTNSHLKHISNQTPKQKCSRQEYSFNKPFKTDFHLMIKVVRAAMTVTYSLSMR